MDDRHAFLGMSPRDGGAALSVMFPKFADRTFRARLVDLRVFSARDDFEELFAWITRELRDLRTVLGASPCVRLTADVGGGVRGQLLLQGLQRLQRERFPRDLRLDAVVLVPAGEVLVRPEGAGFTKAPRPLVASALVRLADSRLDIETGKVVSRLFLRQLEASKQKRARDEEEETDLVDAVSLACYVMARAAAPVLARMEDERRRRIA